MAEKNDTTLSAALRTEFGKGAARRIRRDDKVPAVLYGHGMDPLHLTLPGHQTLLALRNTNALLTLEVDGDEKLALAKQVQRDPIKGFIEHVDLILVRKGEKVTVDVNLHLEGEAAPETLVVLDTNTLAIEVPATDIPESIVISVEGLESGTQILAKDVALPAGAVLAVDEELLVVNVTNAPTAEQLEAELAEAEAEAGIEPTVADEDAEGGEQAEGDSEDEAGEE